MPVPEKIKADDLVIHILNVGFGDNIVIELPQDADGIRQHALVDCRRGEDTEKYLDALSTIRPARKQLAFLCATHPHYDHISGILRFLESSERRPLEFWDSGFRHLSATYQKILIALSTHCVRVLRVSAGMERYFGNVQITVLSPSIYLRNRYATYGIDMNNASIVLRIENLPTDTLLLKSKEYEGVASLEEQRNAGASVAILAGDAEFDSWAKVRQDFAKAERTSTHDPQVKRVVNYLSCAVIKVAHHGSMHSAPLDIYEQMRPQLAVVSTKQEIGSRRLAGTTLERGLFPHQTTVSSLEECGTSILTTDGSYESQRCADDSEKDAANAHPGSIVIVIPPGRTTRWVKLDDADNRIPNPPDAV